MLSSSTELHEIFQFAPEWETLLRNWDAGERAGAAEFLGKIGAKAIFLKALKLNGDRESFVRLLRDHYFQPLLARTLSTNQNLRRFLGQRYVAADEQRRQSLSLSVEISQKLESILLKHLSTGVDDGFKVLLPAYIQRTVHNAVIDFIRVEASWEKNTLQDVYLDPEKDDPRTTVADDPAVTPENQILSAEQVGQLNQLRTHLKEMLSEPGAAKDALTVVDCLYGLGLTEHSTSGQELTMREVCDRLQIQAETMPRRIARCQVLADKGLDLVRQRIYKRLPDIVACWQRDINVNTASRRELAQHLGMTEGEIERLVKGRQFHNLDELEGRGIVKKGRIAELRSKGATAAFVPLEINTATARDLIDILGLSKEQAQSLVLERPFKELQELASKGLVSQKDLSEMLRRGAVLKSRTQDARRADLNRLPAEELRALGLSSEMTDLICRLRPFVTWAEMEESLSPDPTVWVLLRQKFFLSIGSG
jgi:hypothetical protein